jgi:hypothetical protein
MFGSVMPGLVPGIHVFLAAKGVDGRDKPGHDVENAFFTPRIRMSTTRKTADLSGGRFMDAVLCRGLRPPQ